MGIENLRTGTQHPVTWKVDKQRMQSKHSRNSGQRYFYFYLHSHSLNLNLNCIL
jgi:hypothetical protein